MFAHSRPRSSTAVDFRLIADSGCRVQLLLCEYQPAACAFNTVSVENPFQEYLSGVECWSTDLLAVFRGEFEPRILSLGRSRNWSHDASMPDPFIHVFWPFFHPQRRPTECLSGYRSQLRILGTGDIRIFRIESKGVAFQSCCDSRQSMSSR